MDNTALQDSLTRIVQSVEVAPNQIDAAFEGAKGALTELWQSAPDANAQALIQTTWDQVHSLAQHNAQMAQLAKDATLAAVEINSKLVIALDNLDTVQSRAEVAEDELKDLNEAINEVVNSGSTENERISELVDIVTETFFEDGLHLECPGCAASENGWYDSVNHDAVNWICRALFGMDTSEIPGDVQAKFAEHINAAGELIEAWFDEDSKRYMEAQRALIDEAEESE